ncbi:MAG: malonyl CoA-acyl carrier protein transacylase, partial [Dehalococcoidia bacterium]|nr:malonyl CoA-acyl carrier protein transacylase [Dehalococcoidia bacterium]
MASLPLAADTAWVFPGQGAQAVGMGQDLAQAIPAAREVFD